MKYHLITYGCQMNTADSAEMAQPLQSRGFTAAWNSSLTGRWRRSSHPQKAQLFLEHGRYY
jgi:hypothetical protein